MGNNNTNTKLFIEAVLADMSGLSKELRKNLESVDTELPLKFDSEELEEGVLGALREAFRGLESSRFASQLDLSEFISAIFKQLQQGTVTNDKADFVYAFADSVKIFESFAERFGGDAKVVSQTIRELNESLTAQGIQDYLTNLKAVYKFVDNLELKPKDKDRLLASFTSSLGVGVDANGLGDALGLKKILEDDAEKYKDVTKFAVSAKEARKRLIELLGGTDDFKGWNDLLPGTKSRSDTARTRDIAGFISRIEALSGKEITAYLQDKIDDAETDTATRAQLERLQKLYTEKGGWGEYYLKWSEKDNAGLQALTQNNNLIVEMTKRQLEERQKVFETYGKYNSSLLTKGQSPQATIEYDTKAEAAQVNEELTTEEQTRRQIADQINQEAEELKKKLNVLKEIAELQRQVVNSGVEATPEYQEMQYLQDVLDDVTLAVNNKTKAFEDERGVVHSVAKAEVKDLQSIQDKLLEITGFENEEDKMGKMSKPRQVLKELTEEQRKQAEEAQRAAEEAARTRAEEARKGTVLGQLRREQEQEGEKSKDKPKLGATLKKRSLPSAGASNRTSEKTANEREAQALKDINANAENATAGLKKFGDTNSEIAQNVTTVAEALKKEASALNSITRTLLKVEDSKIFQDARKDKLQTALSETRDNIASSQKEVEALQKSTDIKIFNKDHLEEASAQLRSAYKDVATFKDIYSKDASHENMIEMTKREIKLWKAYKEAEKQGITDSNLEAKRLNPANFGIDSNKNADNIKTLRDEIESRKQIYEDYVRQAENIRKELEEIESPPTQKNLEKKDATIKDYQEAIGIIKEYIQAQMELAKVQEASSSESIEAKFNPEQLEQFVTTLGTISETLNKIQTASESFGKNIDFSMVIEQLESINNILSTFMGNITFDDFKDIFTVTIDEAADKIDDFKNALNLETTASRFEEQISQIQKKIEEFQTQLAQRDAKLEDNSLLIEQKETMGIVKEYIQAQQALAEMQQKMTPEATQVFFTPEQLEQFNAIIQSIIDATGKIETVLGNLDNKVDLFPILEQLQSLNNILSNFINNISFDEFTVVFAFAIDKMINKINEFKTALNLDDVTAKYELQISQLQEKSKDLQNQLSEIKSNDNKSVEAIFNLEQLEQFSTTLINISDSLNKIQSALGTLDDNSDIPSITQSVNDMSKAFSDLSISLEGIKGLTLNLSKLEETIETSSAGLNQEQNQFSFLSGSAEEAAEGKRKFVEANKEVFQSIVASTPKIDQEAKALENVETSGKKTKSKETQKKESSQEIDKTAKESNLNEKIKNTKKEIQEVENKLEEVRGKIDKAIEKQAQLKSEISNQEKTLEEKNNAYTTLKSNYEKHVTTANDTKQQVDILKTTLEDLDKQLEQEKQNKEKIESKYNELITKREEIKKGIEEKKKQLETALSPIQEQETNLNKQLTTLNNKKNEKQNDIQSQKENVEQALTTLDNRIKQIDEVLQEEYKFEGSNAASEALTVLEKNIEEFEQFVISSKIDTKSEKTPETDLIKIKSYGVRLLKLAQAAKKAGVSQEELDEYGYDLSEQEFEQASQMSVDSLMENRNKAVETREQIKAALERIKSEIDSLETEIQQVKAEQKKLQEKKRKLLDELKVDPAEKDLNEEDIKREEANLKVSNDKIQKLEEQKTETVRQLRENESYLENDDISSERKQQYEKQLQQLKEEQDAQKELIEQKKENLQAVITEQDELTRLEQELKKKQDLLIQKQKETESKQAEEYNKKKNVKANLETEGKTERMEEANVGANGNTSISSKDLQQTLDLLTSIQKALGTLEDDSDIPSITQSIKAMVEVFQKLGLLIDDINNKKIKFGFSSNPNEKLIGEMNSEEVRKSLTGLFDDAIQKIQKFKTNVDMSETVKKFKTQMSEMEKAARQQAKQIEKLEQALEKEKKAREEDKTKIKVKENKTTPTTTEKDEEKAKQDIIEEKERLKKEIEQKPIEAKIPVEAQLSVEGTKNKNLFDDMSIDDLLENYGEITGSDLSKPISLGLKKGFSTINLDDASDQLLSDLYQQQEELIGSIETRYSKLITSDKYINDELNIEKILNPFREQFTKKGINTKNFSELTTVREEIKKVKAELASSFDSEGKIIGDPLKVKELLEQYSNLTTRVKELKAAIQSPTSEENVALQMAKDADKAKEELEKLKKEVDEFFENRKNDVVRRTAEQVIGTYGTTNEEGKLVPVRSSFFDNNPNYENLIEQQNYVIALAKALNEYKIAVENLKKAKESDIIKVDDLKEANKQVELLENKIKQLETIIRKVGKGKTNATDKNINDLTTKIESILEKNTNLSDDASKRLNNYLDVLKSGASISKTAYDSMSADVSQFAAVQKKSFSVWDMMTLKIREGIAFLATKFSFYQIFNQFRQGFQVIRQFDDALTEMMKVSDETRKSLEAYQKTTFDTADAIGSNALQIQNSTADFMRLGESLKEASESAKTANILMNVSEFQSIDEATKSLIAMSAAYDDLSKAQIIDKLNEVGNNYSISTSGAAEALQASASALKTAGNDMDEALALVTAGNQIVQDVAKAGNGLRTIALRLTGTKSAKEELEEMGEDTDSLITTQSKLRDTIKEATAVASNQFKGFDILDDNGNYKSTYEIMLGIAQIYQEIVDTDKELGRNNANLLLETVAGKTRANIAASIFQSPDVLQAAYESSQNADNSAMKENDKYLESISGHLSQLTNQWQEMWANAANREIINYFIDLGKALLQIIDFFGVLPSTIVGAMVYFNLIKRAAEDKSIIKGIGTWIKGLAEAEGAAGGLATELVSAGSAIKKGLGTVIPVLGGIGTAIGLVLLTVHAVVEHQKQVQKELVDSVRNTNEEWKNQKQTLSDYASQYEELKTKLDTGNLSEQETLEVKQQIYDIQKQITEQYGTNAGKIDLINGKLREQLNIISGISEAEANRIWNSAKYQKGFEIAKKAMTTESDYSLSQAFDINNIKTDEDKALSELVKQYTESRKPSRDSGSFSPYRVISGTPIEAEKQINELIEQIEKLQEQNPNNEKFQKRAEEVISYLNTHIDTITKIRGDNEASYFEGLPIELMATKGAQNYKTYTDYQSAVSNLESAYISGDTKQINKAREAYEEATKAKDEFLRLPENNEYSMLFDQIDTSVVDTKNKTEDATKAIKKSLQTGKEIESDLSRFDEYRKQKKIADNYKYFLKGRHLDKIGNIDNTNTPLIFWDEKEIEKQKEAIESWGKNIEDLQGTMSTASGGFGKFKSGRLKGVEYVFTPIIDDGTGKGKLLTKETFNKYLNSLFNNAGENWTSDEVLRLDAQGLVIDGQKISNVLAQIGDKAGDTGSGIALTAKQVEELMHEWQSRSLGYIENYQDEWKEAIKQGKSFEEYMADQEKDLKDVTKATGKYTKEDKQLYQALKRVIDLDIDRVDAKQAFDESANGSQVYKYALEDLMNVLGYTMDDSALMIDMLVDNEIIYGGVEDAALSATDAYNQFSQEVATAIENVSKLNEVLTESVSGAGISTQNIDAFKEMFGDDYVYALERSANGYHINAEKLQTLTDKQKALMNADFQNTLDAQYDALKRCNDEITSMNSKGQDTSGLLGQRERILQRIQDTQDLMMMYQASTSAYQTWVNAQSNGNEYDMYDKIAAGYDTVKDLIDRGWSGDDTVRSYLDLIYGNSFDAFTASGEECAEMFDNLDKKIEGTSFSINDFFQMDESGKLTSNGIFNFFDAVKEKQKELKKEWLTLDENGNITDFNFGIGGDREVAEALGMDAELVQSILRAAVSAGFKLNLDQPMWAMNELKDKAVAAQEELGGFNNIDFSEFNEEFLKSDEAYETLSGHVSDVYDYIQEIENSDELAPDVKTDMIENAQDMLAYLVALEREAADKSDIDLKIKVAEDATNSIKQLVDNAEELPKELAEYDWDSIADAKGLEKAKDYIEALKGSGAIDTSTAETFLNILYEAIDQLNIIDNYEANPEFKGNTVEAYNDVKNAKEELEQYIASAAQLEKEHNIKFTFSEDEKVKQLLSIIYGEGTPEILGSFNIDSNRTPEKIIEMLESGERDVDVLLHGDTEELEKDIDKATEDTSVSVNENETHTKTEINREENYSSTTMDINDEVYNQKLAADEERMNAMNGEDIVIDVDANTEPAKQKQEEVLQGNQEIESAQPEAELKADNSQANDATNETSGLLSAFNGTTAWGFIRVDTGDSHSKILDISNAIRDIPSYKSTTIETFEKHTPAVNGTAHASGTAFSRGSAYTGGKWGLPNDQTALTGELGTEIVVRDGNWFTVGDNGAEFVNLKKGDINKIVSIYSDVYKINHLIAGNP